jgi:hypothetical protein
LEAALAAGAILAAGAAVSAEQTTAEASSDKMTFTGAVTTQEGGFV